MALFWGFQALLTTHCWICYARAPDSLYYMPDRFTGNMGKLKLGVAMIPNRRYVVPMPPPI